MNLRCFIAIDIGSSIKKEIGEFVDSLKKYDSDIKWVSPENVHLTLKFLGDTPQDNLPGIGDSLRKAIFSYRPFYIKIHGTGLFPNRKNPRVIWVGLENTETIGSLKGDIEDAMSSFGYQREDKDFRPHLTVGRVRSHKGMIGILKELDNFREKDFGSVEVDGIKLMKSELNPKGAKYTCLYDLLFS